MEIGAAEFQELQEKIERVSGILLTPSRRDRVLDCLEERIAATFSSSLQDYLRGLDRLGGNVELEVLASMLEPSETYFHRDPLQLNVFTQDVLRAWVEDRVASGRHRVSAWSAGCSSGEEAYTLAILLMESIPDSKNWSTYVLGTDLNRGLVKSAREAIYSSRAVGELTPHLLDRYFMPEGDRFRVVPELRSLVHFDFGNLSESAPPTRMSFDFIFCRNVLLYFTEEARGRAIEQLASRLADGGFLFLGYSEPSSWVVGHGLVPVRRGGMIVYQRESN